MRGNRPEDLLDRRDMLASALESLARSMSEATCDEPVGFVIDPTDWGGGRLATHLFAAKDKISVEEATTVLSRLNDEHRAREEYPTLVFVTDWRLAEAVLPIVSPSATTNLKAARAKLLAGQYLVVAVGSGGNTYAFVGINRPVPDGQHRASVTGVERQ